jgi:serine/threonine protein kinase
LLGNSGKYRLDTRLGGGGMAEVFLGSMVGAEGFSRRVAIKRVLPGFSDNPAFAQMFIAEAQISSRLVHPNIVSVVDFDRDAENRLFLVMELVEGRDLDALVSTGLLPYPVVIFVISEVLRGLGHAHDLPAGNDVRGVVHRDVSPHNVLLSWEGSVKVSDFGIAKARSASEATASVFIKGKPAYMSPEQANGQPLDGRSDLFAVGIMLWEMLIGRRLFIAEDTRGTLAAVLFGQVPRPRSLRGDVPKDLERVTMKLLERDLPARYATAEEAIQDLLECADAPKGGREALTKILAERFPQQAPVRQSLQRMRSSDHNTPPAHERATIADGAANRTPAAPPVSASPSLSSMMQARTGTLAPSTEQTTNVAHGSSKVAKIAAVAAITLASGVLAFGIVSVIGKSRSKAAPAAAGSGSEVEAAHVTADASTPDVAVIAMTIPDAAIADAPPESIKTNGSAATTVHAEQKFGQLSVNAYPILTVYVDGKKIRDTPVTIRVPVGKHTVRLVNVDIHHDEKVPIQITEGQTTKLERVP